MHIIAGSLRSRRLKTVEGEGYRPAMGRVRESLFSMLSSRLPSWKGLTVLDLFAGSGSLAFEALSRGAQKAWLVEMGNAAARCLQENIQSLELEGRAFLLKEDALKVLRRVKNSSKGIAGPFDLVFLDPPYRKCLAQAALDALFQCCWLSPGAYIVLEIEEGLEIATTSQCKVLADRLFGQTRILVLQACLPITGNSPTASYAD